MRTKIVPKKPPFKKHPLTIAVQACCYTLLGGLPLANAAPTGGAVVGGSGTIAQSGTNTTINQSSQNMAINWQSYNVQSNERVQYIQPNASSISLNRILSNNGSTIAGRIDANGKVILVNPNGILFTSTASLNVGSLIASGLDINPSDFMNGKYLFNEINGTSGTVVNQGLINASLGGNVALIGKQVKNEGVIVANLGTVTLAAGKEAILTFDNGGLLGVRVSKEILQSELGVDPAVLNSGEIQAQGGRVLLTASQSQDIFSRAVNTGGLEPATSVVVNDDGTFTLGGGADVLNSGNINTSTTSPDQNVGRIVLIGENVTSSGTLRADAANGNGGEIELHARDKALLTQNSMTSARSEAGGQGGIVKVLGDKVGLFDQSTVDVSGANGGGQALIGGDFQGKNSKVRNSTASIVNPGVSVYADALTNGNGGKVVVWSDGYTYFLGKIAAQGGAASGDGGFVETSGKGYLQFDGQVDTTAMNGKIGSLLLDPRTLTIQFSGSNDADLDGNQVSFNEPSNSSNSTITASVLATALDGNNVTLEANTDIIFNESVLATGTSSNRGNLTLSAGRSIELANNVQISLNDRNFTATINDGGASTGSTSSGTPHRAIGPAEFNMGTGSSIVTNGGNITIQTGSFQGNDIGDITLQTLNSSVPGPIANDIAHGGNIAVTNLSGNITVNGTVLGTGENPANLTGGNGGLIQFSANAGAFTLASTGSITSNGGNAGGTNSAGGNGGDISISANDVLLSGSINSNGGNATGTANRGNGGAVTVTVGNDLTVEANITSMRGAGSSSTGTNGAITLNGDANGNDNTFTINNDITLAGASVTVNGNGGTDSLVRGGTITNPNTWTITNADVGMLVFGTSMIDFFDIANLTGGSGQDDFYVSTNGTLSGLLDGGAGANDSLTINRSGVNVRLGNQTVGNLNVDRVETIDSTVVGNTIRGPNATNYWIVNGTNSGSVSGSASNPPADANVAFSGFGEINGGTGVDNFSISAAYVGTINGGDGVDTFNISSTLPATVNGGNGNDIFNISTGATITGSLNGEAGDDTFNISANVTAPGALNGGDGNDTFNADVAGLSISTLSGGNGSDTFNINATGVTIASLAGGADAGTDTLRGPDADSTWTVSGPGSGSVSVSGNIAFSEMETLTGGVGTGVDTFNIAAPASIASINGGGGDDIINVAGRVTGTVNGGAGSNRLIGSDNGVAWTIDGLNGGAVGASGTDGYVNRFASIQNLTGGAGDDNFNFTTASSAISGTIDGGAGVGVNTISLLDRNGANTFAITGTGGDIRTTGSGSGTANIVGGFSNIQNLTGGTGIDTFDISGVVAGVLSGGGGSDIFNINSGAVVTGILNGDVGSDTFHIAATVSGTINGGNGDDTFNVNTGATVSGILNGDAGNDSFNILANAPGTLNGGADNDTFTLGASGVAGIIDGGTQTAPGGDTLIARQGVANVWSFTSTTDGSLAQGGATYVTSFVNVENFTGGGTGEDWANLSGAGAITVNVGSYTGFAGVIGGIGSTLAGDDGRTNNWSIQAVIDQNNATTDGQNDGTVNGGLRFVNFDNLRGGDGVDNFVIASSGAFQGTIDGNGGANTLTAKNEVNTWNIHASDSTLAYAGTNSGIITTFNNIRDLTGGNVRDVVTVDNGVSINSFNAGDGNNDVTINGTVAGAITAGAGADTIRISGSAGSGNAGAGNDTIAMGAAGTVIGLIDGGGDSDTVDLTARTTATTVQIGTAPDAAFNVAQIETINANGAVANTLVGDGGDNTWIVDGANRGSVAGVAFTGFRNLTGGAGVDTFTVNNGGSVVNINTGDGATNSVTAVAGGAVTGTITGGIGADTIDVSGSVNAISAGGGDDIIFVRAGGTVAGSVDGGAGNDTFTVRGTVTGDLLGGDGDDYFDVAGGTVSGTIIGGGEVTLAGDQVNVGAGQTVYIGSSVSLSGFRISGIEGVASTDGNLYARNGVDTTWNITGSDSGNATDTGGGRLSFSGFSNLYGNDTSDTFNVTGDGSISGQISAGNGTNRLNVALTASRLGGQVNYIGGTGSDTVQITGTSERAVYSSGLSGPGNNTYSRLAYTGTNTTPNTFNVNYTAASVETVTDLSSVASLSINGTQAGNDVITLGHNGTNATFTVNGNAVAFSSNDKPNLVVDGGLNLLGQVGASDAINITGNFSTAGNNVTLRNANSVGQTGGNLAANELVLDRITTPPAQIDTAVNSLSVTNSGVLSINQTGALVLNQINTSSSLRVVATGNITDTNTSQRNISGALTLTTTSDIILDEASFNYLSGPLALTGANVNIRNSTATNFASVNTTSLTVNSAGDITQTGAITGLTVNTATNAILEAPGRTVTLTNAGNDFNSLTVNAGTVSISDMNRIDNGSITAGSVTLNTATGIGSRLNGAAQSVIPDGPSAGFTTSTANLTVNNTNGGVYIQNGQSATVRITTNGEIGLQNNGNLIVDRLYTNGNNINANNAGYSDVYLRVNGGSAQGLQVPGRSVLTTPDITASNLFVRVPNGGIGSQPRPISIAVDNTFTYIGGARGYVHYYGRDPINIIGADDLVTFSAFDTLSSLRLLEVESLGEFDPAIFSAVRNYYYEDVAIMMPADQRLDAADEEEEGKEKASSGDGKASCERQSGQAGTDRSQGANDCVGQMDKKERT